MAAPAVAKDEGYRDPHRAERVQRVSCHSRSEPVARCGNPCARLPGEYRVNFRNGSDATTRIVETLDAAGLGWWLGVAAVGRGTEIPAWPRYQGSAQFGRSVIRGVCLLLG